MKKTIIVVAGMFIVLVIAFFAYDLMKSHLSPCESIFEQTSVQLGSKLKVLQTQGEVFIGKNKIQDLTETAQVTALNLKTCCIVLNAGNVDSNQFLQCKDTTKEYEAKLDTVLTHIQAAEEAEKAGKAEVLEEKIRALNSSVEDATRLSKELQNQIDTLSGTEPEKKTDTQKNQIATQPKAVYTPAQDSGIKLTTILSQGNDPLTKDLSYSVYLAKKDIEENRKQITYSYDAAPFFKLPVGRYYITVWHGQAHASTEVEVTAGNLAEQTLNLNGGYLKLFTVIAEDMEPTTKDLSYTVYSIKKNIEGNRKQITYSYDAAPLFKLPSGRYYIQVGHGQAYTSSELVVSAGELTEQTLNLNAGYLRLATIAAENTGPITKDLSYSVDSADKDLEGKRRKITYSYAPSPLFKLPAGRYYITVWHGQAHTSNEIEVTAGAITEQTLNLNAGYLKLATVAAAETGQVTKDLSYTVYSAKKDMEGNRKQITYSYDPSPLFRLPVGRYHITASHGQAHASSEVEVTAGEVTKQTLNLHAGFLKLSTVTEQNTEPITKNLSYTIYEARKDLDGNRKQITYSYDASPQFKLPAGRYYIRIDHQGLKADKEVEIIEGRQEAVILELNGP